MYSKKIIALFAVFLIIIYGSFKIIPISKAASPSDGDQVSSDLSLDLDLAQKDPAPAQKQIVQFQVSQARIVTDKGEQATVIVKDEVPQEVKTEPTKDTVNPEQTTSEQVVTKNVEVTTNPNETPSSDHSQIAPSGSSTDNTGNNPTVSPSKNVIPGTNILEPDDNTAPQVPATSISPADQNQNSPAPTPAGSDINNLAQPTAAPTSAQPNPIPPENAPSSNPPDIAPPASNGSSSDNSSGNSSNQSSSSDNNSGSQNSEEDSSAVQGASTTWWQVFLNKILKK